MKNNGSLFAQHWALSVKVQFDLTVSIFRLNTMFLYSQELPENVKFNENNDVQPGKKYTNSFDIYEVLFLWSIDIVY